MNKQYAPARVINPTSLQHLVKLQPGQGFILSLDKKIYNDPKIEILCDNLDIVVADKKEGVYTFVQRKNLDDWSVYSSCMLGEVWIECEDSLSKLVVVQDCLNPEKADHITVINPDHCDIRVQPHNIMELVLYDKEFGYQDEWNWKWRPAMDGMVVEEIGSDTLGLYSWYEFHEYMEIDPPHHRYARFPRTSVKENQFCRQHHFWLRFNDELLGMLNKDLGVQHVGDLDFVGYKNRYDKSSYDNRTFHASVYLDLKKKYRARFLGALGIKNRKEYSFQGEPSKQHASKQHASTPIVIPTFATAGGIVHVPKESPPVIKKVVINKMEPEFLEEGCKVLSAKPNLKIIQSYQFYQNQYHNPYSANGGQVYHYGHHTGGPGKTPRSSRQYGKLLMPWD